MGPDMMRYLVDLIKVRAERHTLIGEVKVGCLVIRPGSDDLIITSNHPIDMCVWNEPDKEAVKRRFTKWWIDSPEAIALITGPCILDEQEREPKKKISILWFTLRHKSHHLNALKIEKGDQIFRA
jgi:hypothetical protein